MKSEKFAIARVIQCSSGLSQGNWVTLKSPQMHLGTSHQLHKPAISSHKSLLVPSKFGSYVPTKAHSNPSSTFLKRHAAEFSPMHSSMFSISLISHVTKTPPQRPLRSKKSHTHKLVMIPLSTHLSLLSFKHTISSFQRQSKFFIQRHLLRSFNPIDFKKGSWALKVNLKPYPWIYLNLHFPLSHYSLFYMQVSLTPYLFFFLGRFCS